MLSRPHEAAARLAPGAEAPPEGPREALILNTPELRTAWANLQAAKEALAATHLARLSNPNPENRAAHAAALRAEKEAEATYARLYLASHAEGGEPHAR